MFSALVPSLRQTTRRVGTDPGPPGSRQDVPYLSDAKGEEAVHVEARQLVSNPAAADPHTDLSAKGKEAEEEEGVVVVV